MTSFRAPPLFDVDQVEPSRKFTILHHCVTQVNGKHQKALLIQQEREFWVPAVALAKIAPQAIMDYFEDLYDKSLYSHHSTFREYVEYTTLTGLQNQSRIQSRSIASESQSATNAQTGYKPQSINAQTDYEPQSKSFDRFLKLPIELQTLIWELALDDREGRIIIPVLECTGSSDTLEKKPTYLSDDELIHAARDTNNCLVEGMDIQECCDNYVIRTPVPALLHASCHSRKVAQKIYIDVQQGGLFDPERDKLLVLEYSGDLTTSWCKIHRRVKNGSVSSKTTGRWATRAHVKHILYHVSKIDVHASRLTGTDCGQYLQMGFRSRAGGAPVETITVLSDGTAAKEDTRIFHTNLQMGWNMLFGNEGEESSPAAELIELHDNALCQYVKQRVDATDRIRIFQERLKKRFYGFEVDERCHDADWGNNILYI